MTNQRAFLVREEEYTHIDTHSLRLIHSKTIEESEKIKLKLKRRTKEKLIIRDTAIEKRGPVGKV